MRLRRNRCSGVAGRVLRLGVVALLGGAFWWWWREVRGRRPAPRDADTSRDQEKAVTSATAARTDHIADDERPGGSGDVVTSTDSAAGDSPSKDSAPTTEPVSETPGVDEHPGGGSAGDDQDDEAAAASTASGADQPIRASRSSMLYHTVDSPYYARMRSEVTFETEEAARAAGYSRWDHKRTQKQQSD